MKKIPIKAAAEIAKLYGYDQVVIIARKVGDGEHITTYGVNKAHCDSAAQQGRALKRMMGWPEEHVGGSIGLDILALLRERPRRISELRVALGLNTRDGRSAYTVDDACWALIQENLIHVRPDSTMAVNL